MRDFVSCTFKQVLKVISLTFRLLKLNYLQTNTKQIKNLYFFVYTYLLNTKLLNQS